jgi:hypothetical protein
MIPESVMDRIKAMRDGKISDRSPVWWDAFVELGRVIATTEATIIKTDIDCSPFALAMLYAEATFSAAADKDIYVDLRASPPGLSEYSVEPFARIILSFNTSSPYKRYAWLPVDIRAVSSLSLYVSQTGAAAASSLDKLGLRLVV